MSKEIEVAEELRNAPEDVGSDETTWIYDYENTYKGYPFYKEKENDVIWWVDVTDMKGMFLISFDKKEVFNLFRDYPWKLTDEQVEIFKKEQPYWANFFKDRKKDR